MSAPTRRHETHVADRFGAQAASYVASAVHAAGADLDRIAERMRTVRPARALDLGCGGGHVAFAMAPHAGTVTALDLSPDMLATEWAPKKPMVTTTMPSTTSHRLCDSVIRMPAIATV
ncbi:class I SAM-dependent methyltransferase, partial [Methylobacterium sp. WL6]|uniref:methyltransferase domain-containing protein n=1 Tax=Methylobacterium sp. WL6 TaxID=2603901 RepID=UPI0011CB0F49